MKDELFILHIIQDIVTSFSVKYVIDIKDMAYWNGLRKQCCTNEKGGTTGGPAQTPVGSGSENTL